MGLTGFFWLKILFCIFFWWVLYRCCLGLHSFESLTGNGVLLQRGSSYMAGKLVLAIGGRPPLLPMWSLVNEQRSSCLPLQKPILETSVGVKKCFIFMCQQPKKIGDSCLKAYLIVDRGFYKEGKRNRTKRSREGLKNSLCEDEHSPFW